jgi:Zn-dependent peptidase ImmA (M78 family)/DNA-binding XRE family transcriptional regulator
MIEALITPKMVTWAMKRGNWTHELLAKKMSVTIERIIAWENDNKLERPSFNQAIQLSNALNVPLGYLYLSTPPTENIPLPDLRTISNKPIEKPSPDFIDTLYDAYRKQQWYREYLVAEGVPELEFANKYKATDNPKVIAADMQKVLGLNDGFRKDSSNWEDFLRVLVRHVEQTRILVLRNGVVGNNVYRKLDVNEFRGFAIYDNIAPLVFINAGDYNTAQIFTLIHEVAHIWIGQSGISNLNYQLKSAQQQHSIDRLCDAVAGEVLVPEDRLISEWDERKDIEYNIDLLARYFRVSSFVILRRLYTLDLISKDVFNDKYDSLLTKVRPKSNNKEGGGDFHALLTTRNSFTLTSTLIAGLSDGSVSPKEASQLLNIKMASLTGVEGGLIS